MSSKQTVSQIHGEIQDPGAKTNTASLFSSALLWLIHVIWTTVKSADFPMMKKVLFCILLSTINVAFALHITPRIKTEITVTPTLVRKSTENKQTFKMKQKNAKLVNNLHSYSVVQVLFAARTARTCRVMDSIRPLKVCCGICTNMLATDPVSWKVGPPCWTCLSSSVSTSLVDSASIFTDPPFDLPPFSSCNY